LLQYIISLYLGFILGWFIFGFIIGRLNKPFKFLIFFVSLIFNLYFCLVFLDYPFMEGIALSNLVLDFVKLIFSRKGYDYSRLSTWKMAIYFWIIPIFIQFLVKKFKKNSEDEMITSVDYVERKLLEILARVEKSMIEEREMEKEREEVDRFIEDKIKEILKKLEKF